MSKLVILRGNSGSGKTTVAKLLQEKFGKNTMRISQDAVRRDMLHVKDGKNTKALPLMKELLIYGEKNSDLVILEGILRAEWYRPLFELAVRLYHSNICAYYFDLSFEETLKRHWTKPNSGDFGEEDLRRWWKEKDFSDVLQEKSITRDQSISDIIRIICEDLEKL